MHPQFADFGLPGLYQFLTMRAGETRQQLLISKPFSTSGKDRLTHREMTWIRVVVGREEGLMEVPAASSLVRVVEGLQR
ncbi:hypothetical protein WJX77_008022 [Trebouxia sp. C0004]